MSVIDVLISLFFVAVLACVSFSVIKYLEDANLLTINKYLAMIASLIFWWLIGAFGALLVFQQWLKIGQSAAAIPTSFNNWSFVATTLTYCLVFHYVMTRNKKRPINE
jgi:hypothetical protein